MRLSDAADCRALLRSGSRSFAAASLLLPARVRRPATLLYAFCRVADDAIDGQGATAAGGAAALAALRHRLDRAYAGDPLPDPVDRGLALLVTRHGLPRALPEALLEGFAWDAAGRRYATLPDLTGYAVRVAGTVGVMMALLMGVRRPELLARACDLGIAMQFSNIARDVGEDARAGRLYLPLDWLAEAGIDAEAWLARPVFTPALGAVVARLLDEAARLYARADPGIAGLPWACRPGIAAARALYAGIGQEVRRRGGDSVSGRAVVPGPRKAALLLTGLAGLRRAAADLSPPVPEAAALLAEVTPWPVRAAAPRWHDIGARTAWVLALFERLERRDLMQRGR